MLEISKEARRNMRNSLLMLKYSTTADIPDEFASSGFCVSRSFIDEVIDTPKLRQIMYHFRHEISNPVICLGQHDCVRIGSV